MSNLRAPHVRRGGSTARRRRAAGLTVLELMIVMAIIGFGVSLGYSGFRMLTHAALGDDANDLSSVVRRTQVLAVEASMPMRLVLDFDKNAYWVEACAGDPALRRVKEEEAVDVAAQQKALEEAQLRLASVPGGVLQSSSPEDDARMATALAGKQVGGRVCHELGGAATPELAGLISLDAEGRQLKRQLNTSKGVKLREVWVQHLESSVTSGQVSISFFPLGWAEKAIIELGSGDDHVYSLLIHGVTGRVEVRDGTMRNPDDHMLRDATGDRVQER